jgi:hypothetical protein
MSPRFKADKYQGDYCEDNLKAFRALFLGGRFAATPLRGGAVAQVADPGQNGQVEDCSSGGDQEHGDTDCILVKARVRHRPTSQPMQKAQ